MKNYRRWLPELLLLLIFAMLVRHCALLYSQLPPLRANDSPTLYRGVLTARHLGLLTGPTYYGYPPGLTLGTYPFLVALGAQWAPFGFMSCCWGALAAGCYALSRLLWGRQAGLMSTVLCLSTYNCALMTQNYFIDYALGALLVWQAVTFLLSRHFTRPLYSYAYGLLLFAGGMLKYSYLPFFCAPPLLWAGWHVYRQRTLHPDGFKRFLIVNSLGIGLCAFYALAHWNDISLISTRNFNDLGDPHTWWPGLPQVFSQYLYSVFCGRLYPWSGLLLLAALLAGAVPAFLRRHDSKSTSATRLRKSWNFLLVMLVPGVFLTMFLVGTARYRFLAPLLGVELSMAAYLFRSRRLLGKRTIMALLAVISLSSQSLFLISSAFPELPAPARALTSLELVNDNTMCGENSREDLLPLTGLVKLPKVRAQWSRDLTAPETYGLNEAEWSQVQTFYLVGCNLPQAGLRAHTYWPWAQCSGDLLANYWYGLGVEKTILVADVPAVLQQHGNGVAVPTEEQAWQDGEAQNGHQVTGAVLAVFNLPKNEAYLSRSCLKALERTLGMPLQIVNSRDYNFGFPNMNLNQPQRIYFCRSLPPGKR